MQKVVLTFEAVLLVSLRIIPALAFAAPFTLLRTPALIRILVGLALALALVSARQDEMIDGLAAGGSLVSIAAGELMVGGAIALCLQLAFGAILWAGGTVDIQAGFGLAMVADPTTQAQMPLAGTVFAYVAAALFFAMGGMFDLLALWSASLDAVPLAAGGWSLDVRALTAMLGSLFLIAIGLFGFVMATRYPRSFMKDKVIDRIASGMRADMLALERQMVAANPGPLNNEPLGRQSAGRQLT